MAAISAGRPHCSFGGRRGICAATKPAGGKLNFADTMESSSAQFGPDVNSNQADERFCSNSNCIPELAYPRPDNQSSFAPPPPLPSHCARLESAIIVNLNQTQSGRSSRRAASRMCENRALDTKLWGHGSSPVAGSSIYTACELLSARRRLSVRAAARDLSRAELSQPTEGNLLSP